MQEMDLPEPSSPSSVKNNNATITLSQSYGNDQHGYSASSTASAAAPPMEHVIRSSAVALAPSAIPPAPVRRRQATQQSGAQAQQQSESKIKQSESMKNKEAESISNTLILYRWVGNLIFTKNL